MLTAAIILAFLAIVVIVMSLIEEEGIIFMCGVILALAAFFFIIAAVSQTHDNSWQAQDAVVYTVATDSSGHAFIITDEGQTLRCKVVAQCTKLEHGDHVNFQELVNAPGQPVPAIKGVQKG